MRSTSPPAPASNSGARPEAPVDFPIPCVRAGCPGDEGCKETTKALCRWREESADGDLDTEVEGDKVAIIASTIGCSVMDDTVLPTL